MFSSLQSQDKIIGKRIIATSILSGLRHKKNKRLQIVDQAPLKSPQLPPPHQSLFSHSWAESINQEQMYNVFVVVSIEIRQFFCYTLIAYVADHVRSHSDKKAREP